MKKGGMDGWVTRPLAACTTHYALRTINEWVNGWDGWMDGRMGERAQSDGTWIQLRRGVSLCSTAPRDNKNSKGESNTRVKREQRRGPD